MCIKSEISNCISLVLGLELWVITFRDCWLELELGGKSTALRAPGLEFQSQLCKKSQQNKKNAYFRQGILASCLKDFLF
jgi:hypothetical protein